MALIGKGLVKLMEECGELTQIAAKKLAYQHSDVHPDGKGSMKRRLEEEIADVRAASIVVQTLHHLDDVRIRSLMDAKIKLFFKWHHEGRSSDYADD